MRNIFERRADAHAVLFAEAQAFIDDGLDLDFVLELFPEDADWLGDELGLAAGVADAYATEAPSYYFEASLKSRFLAAAAARAEAPAPAPVRQSPYRTAIATFSIAAAALVMGALALGFVTSGGAVPGDWNYSFKRANEHLQYALSHGNGRVDVQIRQTEARVQEIRVLSSRGDASPADIQSLAQQVAALGNLAKTQPLDNVTRARILGVADTTSVVLKDARDRQPALDPSVNAASTAVNNVVTVLATPSSTPATTPAATAAPSATPTANPSPSASASPTASPSTTPTPPSATASPTPTAPASKTPSPTASPSSTAVPSPTTPSPAPTGTTAPKP